MKTFTSACIIAATSYGIHLDTAHPWAEADGDNRIFKEGFNLENLEQVIGNLIPTDGHEQILAVQESILEDLASDSDPENDIVKAVIEQIHSGFQEIAVVNHEAEVEEIVAIAEEKVEVEEIIVAAAAVEAEIVLEEAEAVVEAPAEALVEVAAVYVKSAEAAVIVEEIAIAKAEAVVEVHEEV